MPPEKPIEDVSESPLQNSKQDQTRASAPQRAVAPRWSFVNRRPNNPQSSDFFQPSYWRFDAF